MLCYNLTDDSCLSCLGHVTFHCVGRHLNVSQTAVRKGVNIGWLILSLETQGCFANDFNKHHCFTKGSGAGL